jgi:hypothetical protein
MGAEPRITRHGGQATDGTDLAALSGMAKVFGAAGKHAGRQSVEAFKRMFKTLFIFGLIVSFLEGGLLTTFVITHARPVLILPAATIGIFLLWLANYANRRVDKHETDRMSWRKGAVGEYEVGAELERLSDNYFLFNDVDIGRGNIDHIVVGPTGFFAIETKDWKGVVDAGVKGQLKMNGETSTDPQKFLRRAMTLRDELVTMTRSNSLYVRAVMVFPKARVEARFGDTGKVHCMRLEHLCDYIDNPKFSQELSPDRINELVGALHTVAGETHATTGLEMLKI